MSDSSFRLLCAFEGKYLVQETTQASVERSGEHEDSECLSFSCSLPDAVGRGFIEVLTYYGLQFLYSVSFFFHHHLIYPLEMIACGLQVEDHGLNDCFFPFLVAKEDVCSEIQGLESVIDVVSYDESQERINSMNSRTRALNFLNEMGWLLRRSQLRLAYKQVNSCPNVFSLPRFRWLIAFAMDWEWCAVVKNLLDILFQGTIDTGSSSPKELALSECLLHTAVRKKCRPMVEFLLRYRPEITAKGDIDSFLFRPDVFGPSNITPLHVVATVSGADNILDALTDDPGQVFPLPFELISVLL